MRGTLTGIVLALGLIMAATGAAGAQALHLRHCGTLKGPGARFSIFAYQARCPVARRVMKAVFAGKGRRHYDPATGKVYRVIDGWICGTAAGGFSCGKQGRHRGIGPSLNAVAR